MTPSCAQSGGSRIAPRLALVIHLLHNPIYAGTYVYGKSQERQGLVNGEVRRRVRRVLAQADWSVCMHDHHPGYITWEEFMDNKRQLQDNRRAEPTDRGAVREGAALLQGIALCGRCGRRMSVTYAQDSDRAYYHCQTKGLTGVSCFSVPARSIDQTVAELFLRAMQPAEIELSLAVTLEVERQAGELDKQWQLRLEQARYAARLAERRYMAVDPENRVVARTLERDWEEKLREIETIERDQADARQREKVCLTADDRRQILALAKDLPAVWRSPTTTQAERKNLLRMMISDVTLFPIDVPQRQTRIAVLWRTGATSEITLERHRPETTFATPDAALELIIKQFRQGVSDQQIADELNAAGIRTGKQHEWQPRAVEYVRHAEGLTKSRHSRRPPDKRDDGLLSVHGVAAHFGVAPALVRHWRNRGWLVPVEGGGQGQIQWFQIDARVEKELCRRRDESNVARAHRRFGAEIMNGV